MALACHENNVNANANANDQRSISSSMVNRYWTSSLVICPFVDFALACLLLGMATFFLVSRMTQLCNSLVSCWSGSSENDRNDEREHEQHLQQERQQHQVTRYDPQDRVRSCLTCDRSGNLNGICISCIMRVLGGSGAQQSSTVFFQEMAAAAASPNERDLAAMASSPADRGMKRHIELLVDKLQLRITSVPEEASSSPAASPSCGCLRRDQEEQSGSKQEDPVCECWRTQGTCRCPSSNPPSEVERNCCRGRRGQECCSASADNSTTSSIDRPANAEISTQEDQADRDVSSSDKMNEALKAEGEVIESLYYELEQERSASAVAANESMAMITRLQEEKACLFMEARQYQRIVEEKAFHDHKAITILKLLKREAEKTVLEEEIEIYRRTGSDVGEGGGGVEHSGAAGSQGGERRKTSSEEETTATIKAVEEERLSVLERVKLLEQQLQILRGNHESAIHQPGYKKLTK